MKSDIDRTRTMKRTSYVLSVKLGIGRTSRRVRDNGGGSGLTAPLAPPRPFSPIAMLADGALARRVGHGDELAFEELYRRYHAPLYRYCASILGNPQEAEEALQSAMFKAYRALPGCGRELRLRAWLYRIAHNQCLDIVRRRRDSQELSGLEQDGGLQVDEAIVLREDVRQLRRDLVALPPGQRAALLLRELSGLSHVEIGDSLETSPTRAKQLIHDARRNLAAFETGRQLPCGEVQGALSDDDGRVLRGGAIRGHLRACSDCARFRSSIRERGKRLEVLFPPLAPAVAKGLLATVIGVEAGASGGALLTSGLGSGFAGGLAAKIAVVGAAAVAATATVVLPSGPADRIAELDPHRSAPAAERGPPASSATSAEPAAAVRGEPTRARADRPRPMPDPAPALAEPPGQGHPVAREADPAPGSGGDAPAPAGVMATANPGSGGAGASAAVGGASAGVSVDAGAGTSSVSADVGPASVAVTADGSSIAAGVSVTAPLVPATVTVDAGAAGASVQTPLGTVAIPPVLP